MSRYALLLLAFLLFLAPISAGEKPLPTDLSLVPADATGFVHIRLADLWKSEGFKLYRETIMKAGDKAINEFDRRFSPAPSSIDRLTGYFVLTQGKQEPEGVVILSTTKSIDRSKFLQQSMPGAKEEKIAGKSCYFEAREKLGVVFYDDKTMMFGPADSIRAVVTKTPARTGPFADVIASARTKTMVMAINPSALPEKALKDVPPPFQPLVKANLALWTYDQTQPGLIDFRLRYPSDQAAKEAEEAARMGLKMALQFLQQPRDGMMQKLFSDRPSKIEDLPEAAGALIGLGGLNRLEELLKAPPLIRKGNTLTLSAKLPAEFANHTAAVPILIGLLVPAVQKVREAASRTQDMNNLKQMALAMHNYHDAYQGFPSAAICDKAGRPLLSWRVAILPYIEQDSLYKQFKLDEPWDSEHNKKLIAMMPTLYMIPADSNPRPGETHYRVFVGGGALFDLSKKVKMQQITDGTSNTLMIAQTADSVPWTKPDEVMYDAKKALPRFADFYAGSFAAALADGSVRMISSSVQEATLRALITRAGGEASPLP